jgi:hypothetical protein
MGSPSSLAVVAVPQLPSPEERCQHLRVQLIERIVPTSWDALGHLGVHIPCSRRWTSHVQNLDRLEPRSVLEYQPARCANTSR